MAFSIWTKGAPQENLLDHRPGSFTRLDGPPLTVPIPKPARAAPEPKREFDPVAIMQQVTKVLEKYVSDMKDQEAHSQKLQIELTEALLAQEALRKKIDFLEVENIEIRNNLQASEAANYDKTRTLEALRGALDSLGIQKRQRNGNRKKEEAQCTDPSPSPQSSSPVVSPPATQSNAEPDQPKEVTGLGASSTEGSVGTEATK